jgi:hypothetical protein
MRKMMLTALFMGLFAVAGWCQEVRPLFVTLTHRSDAEVNRGRPQDQPVSLTLPADTLVAVQMLSGVHTRISRVNDPIMAQVLKPVYVGGHLALPSGTLLDGRVTFVRPTGHLHRAAELGLRFERIMLPDGQAESIGAILSTMDTPEKLHLRLDSEGHLSATGGFSWKALLGGFVGLGALGGVRAAMVAPVAVSSVVPLGGAALTGFELLWPRGRDVDLPPETNCRVRLNQPLTVRVQW